MEITVILCTYNRCQSLAKALESVAASQLPDSIQWEVLVVDNNSKDQTKEVTEGFCRRYPGRFRYLFERKQGKSNALNTGIREARGSILAFMDDDVIVAPTWLMNITEPLNSTEWGGTGGRICAQEIFSAPAWLPLEGEFSMAGMLALFDLGDHANRDEMRTLWHQHGFSEDDFREVWRISYGYGTPSRQRASQRRYGVWSPRHGRR